MPADFTTPLWRFIRGDTAPRDFEQWLFAEPRLERHLGSDLYEEAIATDFRDAEAVFRLRSALAQQARSTASHSCTCIRLRDLDVVDMGTFGAPAPAFESDREWSHQDVFRTLTKVRSHGEPLWWLWAARCEECGQGWLVGQEERQNDVFCLRRLTPGELEAIEQRDEWPPDFDRYETLLRIGAAAGRSARFVDPLSSSLGYTIADLARARPGVAVSELASLLNLDRGIAAELARRAARDSGVEITFDV